MSPLHEQESSASERELLRSVAAGDEQAFRKLVETYWTNVYYNTLTLVKDAAVAQELTQDIFLKIWLKREALTTVENFGGYLYILGRNQVISALRRKIAGTAVLDAETLQEDLWLPDLQLESKDAFNILLQGLERLSPQQKLIFRLSRMEGLSHEQIAHQLDLSRNTVKVHMVAALNQLRVWFSARLGYSKKS